MLKRLRPQLAGALFASVCSGAGAQWWLDVPPGAVPRTASGEPDLSAPALRTADGRPDLSGVWQPIKTYSRDLAEDLHVIERYRRPDFGHLEIEITIDDPGAYSAPWTVEQRATVLVDTDLLEFACNENNRDLQQLPDAD